MKPPQFAYYRPESLASALQTLAELGPDAKVLAGGQSLVPVLNFRLARPQALVDLNVLAELRYIRRDNGYLAIGAMTRHREAERSPLVAEACPLLAEALSHVGHTAIRARGTVGGSVAHADPAAEIPAVLVALEGEVVLKSQAGQRTLPANQFFLGPLMTAIEPGEILTEIRLPEVGGGAAFEEVARRHGDFALAGVAAAVRLDPEGRCTWAALAACGVGPAPVRLRAAEGALAARDPLGPALDEAARLASAAVEPDTDIHGSAEYRRKLAGALTRRAIERAVGRARGGSV